MIESMGTQGTSCAACGKAYPPSAEGLKGVCPHCGAPLPPGPDDEDFVTPDPEGAAIGRIPLRRKRISKNRLLVEERQAKAEDLPRRPQQPLDGGALRASEARRALQDDVGHYGRPVVHDLSIPGLDPPPIPTDSEPEVELPRKPTHTARGLAPVGEEQAADTPQVVHRATPPKGPLEVGVPAAGLERRTTEGDAAIMVFVPDAPILDHEPAAERIGGGHHRRSRATVPISPGERPRVRRPTASHGNARARPESTKGGGGAWLWILFFVGLAAAATLYLLLTR